jgi:hypothetical protein
MKALPKAGLFYACFKGKCTFFDLSFYGCILKKAKNIEPVACFFILLIDHV